MAWMAMGEREQWSELCFTVGNMVSLKSTQFRRLRPQCFFLFCFVLENTNKVVFSEP